MIKKLFLIEELYTFRNITLFWRLFFTFRDTKIKFMQEPDHHYPNCPVRNILSRMCDKWSLLILSTLSKNGIMRYKDLKNNIPDISQKMLSSTLKRLVECRLIKRKMYKEIPPRVEYSLTGAGKELMPALKMMVEWAVVHFETIMK